MLFAVGAATTGMKKEKKKEAFSKHFINYCI
jgi:hypothetical protein